ncbi:MAG: surface lipoprotein assembly modifier [Pseudomonadota bacterium]
MLRALFAALIFGLFPGPAAQAQETVSLSSEALLAAGEQALAAGDTATAAQIAESFLAQMPGAPRAILLSGYAALRAGDTDTALARARTLWRSDAPREARRAAAELAAEAHLTRRNFGAARRWLARAARLAPPGRARDTLRSAAARAKEAASTTFTFSLSIAPSSNVNGGADSPFITAEGVPFVGTLSESAQALPGTVADLSFSARHRLSQSSAHRLIVGAALFARHVWLSEDARERAPDLSNSDLSYRRLDAFVQREMRLGAQSELRLSAGPGFVWQAEEARDALLNVDARLTTRFDAGLLRLGFRLEEAFAQDDTADQRRLDLSASWRLPLAGGRFTAGARVGETQTASDLERSDRRTLRAGWQRPLEGLPLTVSLDAARTFTTYPDYTLLGIPVTGGRRDIRTVLRAQAALGVENPWGLVPVLSFTAEETTSNVSRFDTDELGLGLSIRRSF